MKRSPAYDPPEYVAFKPRPELVEQFGACIESQPERQALVAGLGSTQLLRLYEGMLRFRLHDIMLKRWVRQGVISKAWLGTGEEAVTVGSVHALEPEDTVGPMIRNAGVCHEKGMSLEQMFLAYLGSAKSPTRGRDLHIGDLDKGVVAPISHVGSLVPVCAGIALSYKLRAQPRVSLTYVGDGATRTAEFHEGLSLAAAQRLPLIVLVQNNQIALGTPRETHSLGDSLRQLHAAYGVPGLEADGNNVLDVWAATRLLAERARAGEGAALLLVHTFRMGGHATHDEAEARRLLPAELFEHWGARDPIGLYEAWLCQAGHANQQQLEQLEADVDREVEQAAAAALESRKTDPADPQDVAAGVFRSVIEP